MKAQTGGRSRREHSFLAEDFQSGPERSRARRSLARRSEPLTARTALRQFPRGRNGPLPRSHEEIFQPITLGEAS